LNRRLISADEINVDHPQWLFLQKTDPKAVWRRISFPATPSSVWAFSKKLPSNTSWNGRPVEIIQCLPIPKDEDHYSGISWSGAESRPDRIVLVKKPWSILVAPLWTKNPLKQKKVTTAEHMKCSFPPRWKDVCGVQFSHYGNYNEAETILNPNNPIVRNITPQAWEWVIERRAKGEDPLPLVKELLTDRPKASAWILQFAQEDNHKLWEGLRDREQDVLWELWRTLFGPQQMEANVTPVSVWIESAVNARLRKKRRGSDWSAFRAVAVLTGTNAAAQNYPPVPWLEESGWAGDTLLDDEEFTAASAYGLTAYPFLVALDADGNVVARTSGERSAAEVAALADAARGEG
jgi:hypothetical protein